MNVNFVHVYRRVCIFRIKVNTVENPTKEAALLLVISNASSNTRTFLCKLKYEYKTYFRTRNVYLGLEKFRVIFGSLKHVTKESY